MNWAWRQLLAPTAKLVLMSMVDAADDPGVCWPSVPTLARNCCVSERTVRRIMGDLEASGLWATLMAVPSFGGKGPVSGASSGSSQEFVSQVMRDGQ